MKIFGKQSLAGARTGLAGRNMCPAISKIAGRNISQYRPENVKNARKLAIQTASESADGEALKAWADGWPSEFRLRTC
ncbi:MAG: hypothetical protein KGK16_15640 [Bradyrhizobium sp.]|nr:hypothetical protein [Bradyrhizobium sp.]